MYHTTAEDCNPNAGGLGSAMYNRQSAVQRVQSRWPPRATAALVAFLRLSDTGEARGYDGTMQSFSFKVMG